MVQPAYCAVPLTHPDPVEHALLLLDGGMDAESVAEALLMRRAAGDFMRAGLDCDPQTLDSLVRVFIGLRWCERGLCYRYVAAALSMAGATDAVTGIRLRRFDRRWRHAERLRCAVHATQTTGREVDIRR